MRPSQVVARAADYLERHGVPSPRENAEALLMMVLGTDRAGLYTRPDGLSAREARTFGRALCQRCAGTPLQHLTGEQAFRGISLEVRPGVFVPRPETERLVEAALEELAPTSEPVVVDVGTGSGAVALAIKHERRDAAVLATDRSPEAVALTHRNAERLGLDVRLFEGDLLDPVPSELRGWVDLVVSNPPYVRPDEVEDLPVDVLADPELALVGDLSLTRRLAEEATRWLRDGGAIALEIGSDQGAEVVEVLSERYGDVRIHRDLAGRDRIALGRRP